ncbi:MAG: TPR repeat protein [Sulfurimonas sp.]|jgi:TPR repeat protein
MKKILVGIFICSVLVYGSFLKDANLAYSNADYKVAIANYTKACDANIAEGCFKLAHMYENKQGLKQDFEHAYKLYDQSCSLGHAKGCFKVGVCYDQTGVIKAEKDYKKAEKYYTKSCNNGFALACYNLGDMYQYYLDPENNKKKMIDMYEKACKGEASIGCYKLGNLYGEKDKINAMKWYKTGCDQTDTQSCFRLVDLQIKIIAALDPDDYKKVFKEYEEECKTGDMLQCYKVGAFYSTGRGVRQNYSKAKNVYDRACRMGDNASCIEFMMLQDSGF